MFMRVCVLTREGVAQVASRFCIFPDICKDFNMCYIVNEIVAPAFVDLV